MPKRAPKKVKIVAQLPPKPVHKPLPGHVGPVRETVKYRYDARLKEQLVEFGIAPDSPRGKALRALAVQTARIREADQRLATGRATPQRDSEGAKVDAGVELSSQQLRAAALVRDEAIATARQLIPYVPASAAESLTRGLPELEGLVENAGERLREFERVRRIEDPEKRVAAAIELELEASPEATDIARIARARVQAHENRMNYEANQGFAEYKRVELVRAGVPESMIDERGNLAVGHKVLPKDVRRRAAEALQNAKANWERLQYLDSRARAESRNARNLANARGRVLAALAEIREELRGTATATENSQAKGGLVAERTAFLADRAAHPERYSSEDAERARRRIDTRIVHLQEREAELERRLVEFSTQAHTQATRPQTAAESRNLALEAEIGGLEAQLPTLTAAVQRQPMGSQNRAAAERALADVRRDLETLYVKRRGAGGLSGFGTALQVVGFLRSL